MPLVRSGGGEKKHTHTHTHTQGGRRAGGYKRSWRRLHVSGPGRRCAPIKRETEKAAKTSVSALYYVPACGSSLILRSPCPPNVTRARAHVRTHARVRAGGSFFSAALLYKSCCCCCCWRPDSLLPSLSGARLFNASFTSADLQRELFIHLYVRARMIRVAIGLVCRRQVGRDLFSFFFFLCFKCGVGWRNITPRWEAREGGGVCVCNIP